jgi:death-on-curing protein
VEPLFLSLEEVLEIHRQQIERYGGASGVRDLSLLESAIAQPQASFSSEFLHASIPAMAAAYLFHICRNHPFIDGNKRVAANAAITFLLINDWEPTFTEDALVDTVLAVASSSMTKEGLVHLFEANCVPRPEAWGCECKSSGES